MDNKETPTVKDTPVMHDFSDSSSSTSFFTPGLIVFFLVVLLFGVGSGYLLAKNGGSVGGVNVAKVVPGGDGIEAGKSFGSDDTKTYKDIAEGTLKDGGIEGEGQYHLERPGGVSQNVYLTSSTVDLSQFMDQKIKVWGQTQTAQKAGWLMDVGRVEVL